MVFIHNRPFVESEETPDWTPDWTYEELIDAVVIDKAANSAKKIREFVARGLIRTFPTTLIVEEVASLAPIEKIEERRFWYEDETGVREISRTEFQEEWAAFEDDRSRQLRMMFKIERIRFEANYRYVVFNSWGANAGKNHISVTRNRIVRLEDGTLSWEYLQTLAIN